MTIPQTTVAQGLAIGLEGQLVDRNRASILTVFDDADGFFGRAIEWDNGTVDNKVRQPASSGTLAGISVYTHEFDSVDVATAGAGIPSGQNFNILRRGLIWVAAEVAVTATNGVWYRFQNAGADPEGNGRFRDDNDSASGDVTQITNARWHTNTAVAGDLALLEIWLTA
ncbi:MAG: hypothetical protein GY926_19605 [bacterium]|nr:hypothetical protein [bacterium]